MSDDITQPNEAAGVIAESPTAEAVTSTEPGSSTGEAVNQGSAPETVEEKPERRPNRDIGRSVGQLRRQIREQREEMRQLRAMLQQAQPAPVTSTAKPDTAPKREDFQNYEDFVDARAEFRARQVMKTELERREQEYAKAQQEAQRRDSEKAGTEALDRFMSTGMEKYGEDFEDVGSDDLAITEAMAAALVDLEYGVDVAWHLRQHPKEAARIAKLSPARQISELGKLEDKVLAASRASPSSAPDPIRPVKTKQAPASDEPKSEDGDDAWFEKRRNQLKKTRGY